MLWQWCVDPTSRVKTFNANVLERSVAKKISKPKRDFYWRRSEIYRKCLLEGVFDAGSPDCTTIMVLPIQDGHTNYRDVELPCVLCPGSLYSCFELTMMRLYILSGYFSLNMSPMMKAPEATAIGKIPRSR